MAHQLINSSAHAHAHALLAFGFLSPWLLMGLALGAVPILIQWLHRRNYTERVWAAMRFLRAATKAQSRRLRFESLLLLAIRTLIILLVSLALAEPFLESAGWIGETQRSVHRLIVIDTSLSMQHEIDGQAVSERAREAARRIVTNGRVGDSYQVVLINREGEAVIREPAFDQAEVLSVIDQLAWTEELGEVSQSLRLSRRLLDEADVTSPVQTTVISDFQRSNWWPKAESDRSRITEQIVDLADASELAFVNVGGDGRENAALGELTITPRLASSGSSIEVSAPVFVSGGDTSRELAVELVENDRVLQTRMVSLVGESDPTVSFTVRWQETGQHGFQLRLPDDGLAADNHRWGVVDIRDELKVLLVNGRTSGDSLGKATDFVELALAPVPTESSSTFGRRGLEYRPVVMSEAEFARTELADFDCVVLCDVPFLSEAEQARLQTYVRGGGGLMIGLGPQVHLDAYSLWLNSMTAGLMPVSLVEVMGDGEETAEPFRFAEPVREHVILNPFFGNPQAGLTTANIYRYVRCELPSGDVAGTSQADAEPTSETTTVRSVLLFNNGDPAILSHRMGAGRVLLVTTSLDDQWGSWALWPSYLPMVHRMVDYVSEGTVAAERLVGEPLRREYPVQTVGFNATVQVPDGRRTSGRTTLQNGATKLTFDEVDQSGLYRVILGPPVNDTELVAVNVDVRESDLDTLTDAELSDHLLAGGNGELISESDEPSSSQAEQAVTSSMAGWLLMAALTLLLVEQVMAWRPRLGIGALVFAPLLMAGVMLWPAATVSMVIVALLAIWGERHFGVLHRLR